MGCGAQGGFVFPAAKRDTCGEAVRLRRAVLRGEREIVEDWGSLRGDNPTQANRGLEWATFRAIDWLLIRIYSSSGVEAPRLSSRSEHLS